MSFAFALPSRGVPLVVQVADDQGKPVPTATVRIEEENLRHRVNRRTGKWRDTMIYPQHSEPVAFAADDVIHITAMAPGYLPRTIVYRFHAFRNTVSIPLEPLHAAVTDPRGGPTVDIAALLGATRVDCAPTPDSAPSTFQPAVQRSTLVLDPETIQRLGDLQHADPWLTAEFSGLMLQRGPEHFGSAMEWAKIGMAEAHTTAGADYVGLVQDLYRVRALAHHLQWQQWELTHLSRPTKSHRDQVESSRKTAADVATRWVEWADAAHQDTELAAALCMAASDRPLECTP